jgi:hypothetical protein
MPKPCLDTLAKNKQRLAIADNVRALFRKHIGMQTDSHKHRTAMKGKHVPVTYTQTYEVYRYDGKEMPAVLRFARRDDLDAFLLRFPGSAVRMQEVFVISTSYDESGVACTRSATRLCEHRTGYPPSWILTGGSGI